MAEIRRDIVAKLRLDSEGDAELFGKTAEEVVELKKATDALGEGAEGLGKSFEQGTRAVEAGSTRASAAVEKIGVSLANYRAQLKAAEEAGATIGDEQIAELRRLEGEYENAVDAVGKLRTAQQQAKRDIDDATEAAGGQAERINSLDDIVRKLAEDLGPAAVKWLSWGTAAVGALTAGYAAGTKLREGLNELTDGGFDRFVQSWSGATKAAEAWVDVTEEAIDVAQRLKNEINVLAHNGIDVAGKSAADVHALFEQFSAGLREHAGAVQQVDAAYDKWKESIGPLGDELDKLGDQLIKNIQRLAKEHPELGIEEIVRRTLPQLDTLIAKYGSLETETKKRLEGLAQQWRELVPQVDSATGQIKKSIDDLVAATQKVVVVGEVFAKEFDLKPLKNLADAISKVQEAAAETANYDALIAKLQELNAIIDPISANALELQGNLAGVFLGLTPTPFGVGLNEEIPPPPPVAGLPPVGGR